MKENGTKEMKSGIQRLLVLGLLVGVMGMSACGNPENQAGSGIASDAVTQQESVEERIPEKEDSTAQTNAGSNSDTELISEAGTAIPESEVQTDAPVLEITVMGNKYLYLNQEIMLKDFMLELKRKSNATISVTDSNATQNAMEDLLQALDEAGTAYSLK